MNVNALTMSIIVVQIIRLDGVNENCQTKQNYSICTVWNVKILLG